jgi:uncharacterized membrane protein YedE/YeeE
MARSFQLAGRFHSAAAAALHCPKAGAALKLLANPERLLLLCQLCHSSFARKRTVSLLGLPMRIPTATQVDRRLFGGSLLFGIGWGIAGFCPGPALVALGMGEQKALVFVVSMLVGMGVFELLERRKA